MTNVTGGLLIVTSPQVINIRAGGIRAVGGGGNITSPNSQMPVTIGVARVGAICARCSVGPHALGTPQAIITCGIGCIEIFR